jgi:hypothetical protein
MFWAEIFKFSTFIIFPGRLKIPKLPGIFQASWKEILPNLSKFQDFSSSQIFEHPGKYFLRNTPQCPNLLGSIKKTPKLPQVAQTLYVVWKPHSM